MENRRNLPMSRDRENSLAKMRQCFLRCPQFAELMRCPTENLNEFKPLSSCWEWFLCGSQVERWDQGDVPPILAAQIFPSPGQQQGGFPIRFKFFHTFPHQEGGNFFFILVRARHAVPLPSPPCLCVAARRQLAGEGRVRGAYSIFFTPSPKY
jgi:hypothetical protein